jgi:hypothetical protein
MALTMKPVEQIQGDLAKAAQDVKVKALQRIVGILATLPDEARDNVISATAAFFGHRIDQESVEVEVRRETRTVPAADAPVD